MLIFTDSLPMERHKDGVEKAIKTACRADLDSSIRFESYHHKKESNAWIQATDYCAWGVFRKWEQKDSRTYDQLRPRLAVPELDVLARGKIRYYATP